MDARYIQSFEEERRIREAALDRTIEATFPASDPASSIPDPHYHDELELDHEQKAA